MSPKLTSSARAAPVEEQILRQTGIPVEKVVRLLQGKVISHELMESNDKEMALSTAIYPEVTPDVVADFIARGDMAAIDSDIISFAEIPADASVEAFKHFAFTAKHHREVDDLLDGEAGDAFNLSAEEIAGLSSLRDSLKVANAKTKVTAASERYRQILLQRVIAYRSRVADYDREDGKASPASELRSAVENSQVLVKHYPNLYQAWLNYPANVPGNI